MADVFNPRPYQTLAIDFIANHPRCALWAGMGMGKTSTVLTLLDAQYNVAGCDYPTLVMAPKRVAQSTWPDETRKWQHLKGLEISAIVGTPEQRLAALKRDVPVHTINYDNLPWLIDLMGSKWPWRRVVSDESTRLKGFRSKQGGVRAQALATVAHTHVKEWINLTGTPAPNGLKDLWGQTWFLDQGMRLGRTYGAFEERWFGWRRATDALTHKPGIQPVIFPFAQEQIQERLKDICLTLDPKDWFDLKDPIITPVYVDLPPRAQRAYKEMEKELFTVLGGHEIEAVNAASKSMKCLQIANGAAYIDSDADSDDHPKARQWQEVHDEKIEALKSIVAESGGMPILVAYQFKSDLSRILKAFPEARHLDDNPATLREWNDGRIPMLVAHPASAGHGLNLQDGGNIIAFFGHWWNLELHDQIIERIGPVRQAQAGHDRAVFIYYIVARGTVDEVVMARHVTKRGVQDLLLDYMKQRK